MAPAHLDHPHQRLLELADRLLEDVGGRHEVGVEDEDELAGGDREARVEGARLEAGAVVAVEVVDVDALRAIALDGPTGQARGLVRRVVQDLDLEKLPRIADRADRVEQPIQHVHLVVDRELDGDLRETLRKGGGEGAPIPVPEVEPHHDVAVGPQDGQDDEGDEVQAEDAELEWAHGDLATRPPLAAPSKHPHPREHGEHARFEGAAAAAPSR